MEYLKLKKKANAVKELVYRKKIYLTISGDCRAFEIKVKYEGHGTGKGDIVMKF